MSKKNKNIFLILENFKKKGLVVALLFFVIFGLVFSSQSALAQEEWTQPPGLGCAWYDLACRIGEFVLSVMIKIVMVIFFGIPLLLSTLFVGIMSLILGWIIGPNFISLKFTQNPFVDIGLSITRNFANMGFIIFLVAIGLATALRIREYQAKKTLPTLILIALLINFSPVFCGFIIDASNIVMNFFLSNITGLTGFWNFIDQTSRSLWNLIVGAGFNVWANIAATMQLIVMIVFNFFAGFIFILFSGLFIMRYIMLWILVILSPIAFVSYILPITRRGRSLLSWKKWWEQLIAWSIIGIIASFFLYLGFTMISMINADPGAVVTAPSLEGLGLMNNILPYLIPLVLLWIAYDQTKKTSAMFAREIIEMPEKVAKGAVMAAAIAATGGAAMAAAGKLKGALGTLSSKTRFAKFAETHPTAAKLATPIARPMQWSRRQAEERVAPTVREKVITPIRERAEKIAEEHPEFTGYVKAAGRGLKTVLWDRPKEEVKKGFKTAWEDWKRRTAKIVTKKEEKLREILRKIEREEEPTMEDVEGFRELEDIIDRGERVSEYREVVERLLKRERKLPRAKKPLKRKAPEKKPPPSVEEKKPPPEEKKPSKKPGTRWSKI